MKRYIILIAGLLLAIPSLSKADSPYKKKELKEALEVIMKYSDDQFRGMHTEQFLDFSKYETAFLKSPYTNSEKSFYNSTRVHEITARVTAIKEYFDDALAGWEKKMTENQDGKTIYLWRKPNKVTKDGMKYHHEIMLWYEKGRYMDYTLTLVVGQVDPDPKPVVKVTAPAPDLPLLSLPEGLKGIMNAAPSYFEDIRFATGNAGMIRFRLEGFGPMFISRIDVLPDLYIVGGRENFTDSVKAKASGAAYLKKIRPMLAGYKETIEDEAGESEVIFTKDPVDTMGMQYALSINLTTIWNQYGNHIELKVIRNKTAAQRDKEWEIRKSREATKTVQATEPTVEQGTHFLTRVEYREMSRILNRDIEEIQRLDKEISAILKKNPNAFVETKHRKLVTLMKETLSYVEQMIQRFEGGIPFENMQRLKDTRDQIRQDCEECW